MGATQGRQIGIGVSINGQDGAATMSDGRAIFGLSPPLAKLPQTATCTVDGNNIKCSTTFKDCAKVDLQGQPGQTVWSCVPEGEANAGPAQPVNVTPQAPGSAQPGWNNAWMWIVGIIILVIIIAVIVAATKNNKAKVVAVAPVQVA